MATNYQSRSLLKLMVDVPLALRPAALLASCVVLVSAQADKYDGTSTLPVADAGANASLLAVLATTTTACFLPVLLYSLLKRVSTLPLPAGVRAVLPMPTFMRYRIDSLGLLIWELLLLFTWTIVSMLYLDSDAWATRLGHICTALMAWIMLTSTRNSLLRVVLDVPFERTLKSHRVLGRLVLITALGHTVGYLIDWFNAGGIATVVALSLRWKYALGLLSLLALILVWGSSVGWIRRGYFEVFYYSHFLFLAFLILAVLHSPPILLYILPGALLWLADRLIRFDLGRAAWKTLVFQTQGADMVKLVVQRSRKSKLMGLLTREKDKEFTFEPGSYVFLCFPEISRLDWHPFTVSSSMGVGDSGLASGVIKDEQDLDRYWAGNSSLWSRFLATRYHRPSESFTIHLKVLGAWTRKVHELAGTQDAASTRVLLDGPYGKLSLDYWQYQTVVFASGGIGVTPMVSMLLDIFTTLKQAPDATRRLQRVHFIWVVRDFQAYRWFSEVLSAVSTSTMSSIFLFSVYLTRAEALPQDQFSSVFRIGYPRWDEVFSALAQLHKAERRVALYTCGPDGVTNAIRDAAAVYSTSSLVFDAHLETFEF